MKVVNGKDAIDTSDIWVQRMEERYPGAGVADFVVGCWQELQEFNASGGYSVQIPWNQKEQRELTAAEVIEIVGKGKGKRGSR